VGAAVGSGRYRVIVEPVPLATPTGDREADVEAGMQASSPHRAVSAAGRASGSRSSPIWGQATPTGTRASSRSVE
jgi:hypothetical protein